MAFRPVAIAVLLVPVAGYGASWEYVPTVATGITYETNPNYVSDNQLEDDAYSGVVDLTVDITRETGRTRFAFRPRTKFAAYTGAENSSDLNIADYYLPLSALWVDQKVQYAFSGGYSQISTRDSEVVVTDPNNPGQPGSSGRLLNVDENQDRWYAAPSASYQLTPRDLLSASFSYDDIRYDQAALTNRSNYDYGDLTTTWTRSLNLQSRLTASLNVNGFRATQPDNPTKNETLSYGFQAGYQYSLSDLTSVGITAGTSRSDIKVTGLAAVDADNNPSTPPLPCFDPTPPPGRFVLCELRSNEKNFVGEIFLRQKTATTITTELSVSRSVTPSSDGAQVTQDLARAYATKQFGPRWSGSAGMTYIKQQAVGQDVAGSLAQRFDRKYLQGEASVSWRLTTTLSLDGRYYYYSDEQVSGTTYNTINHLVSLQIRYSGIGTH